MNIKLTQTTIAKLELGPDDIVVLRIMDPNYKPTTAMVEEMRERVRGILGEDRVIMVLGFGLDLEVVEPRPASGVSS